MSSAIQMEIGISTISRSQIHRRHAIRNKIVSLTSHAQWGRINDHKQYVRFC